MKLQDTGLMTLATDLEVISGTLELKDGQRLLELGCGAAQTTRELAESHPGLAILATEVDEIQHQKNLQIDDLPNVTFLRGGAQEIALDDASVDAVIMLKSLHHVPSNLLAQSLDEVRRVLKPGGLAYLSEPIATGPFNDILRLFHDEAEVRRKAFDAIQQAVASGRFELVEQIFYSEHRIYEGFADFSKQILGVTHTHFDIDAPLMARIEAAFEAHVDQRGVAEFQVPQRVDLLRRPRGDVHSKP